MASIADLISNLKKKLTGGYNTVADALPIVPNTSQIKSFTANPVQFMSNPSYNGGNNLFKTTPFKLGAQVQTNIYKNAQSPDPMKNNFAKMYVNAGEAVRDYFDPRKTPTLLSKQGAENYGKAVGLTALPVLNMAMAPKVTPQTFLGSAGIGAGFNAVLGNKEDHIAKRLRYGAISGIQSAPLTRLVTGFSNPVTDKLVSKIPLKNLAPKAKAIVEGVTRGAAAIPEGMAINAAQRQPYTPLDLALDVATGSGLSSYAGAKMGKAGDSALGTFLDWYKKNSMTSSQKAFARQAMMGNVRAMHPEDLAIFDQANTVLKNKRKFAPDKVREASSYMYDFAEKYLPRRLQPDGADANLIANRLQKRMAQGDLQTFEGGFAKLDEPIVGTGKSPGLPKSTADPIEGVRDEVRTPDLVSYSDMDNIRDLEEKIDLAKKRVLESEKSIIDSLAKKIQGAFDEGRIDNKTKNILNFALGTKKGGLTRTNLKNLVDKNIISTDEFLQVRNNLGRIKQSTDIEGLEDALSKERIKHTEQTIVKNLESFNINSIGKNASNELEKISRDIDVKMHKAVEENILQKFPEAKLTHTSDFGSKYYKTNNGLIRVSDHEIPQTSQRDYYGGLYGDKYVEEYVIPVVESKNELIRALTSIEENFNNKNLLTDLWNLANKSTSTGRIQEQKVKFSPTQMTREEMIARDMLKKKTITPQQYNEIAVKNEGKIKPIQGIPTDRISDIPQGVIGSIQSQPLTQATPISQGQTKGSPKSGVAKIGEPPVQSSSEGIISNVKNYVDQLYTQAVDRFHPLSKIAKQAGQDQTMRNAITQHYGAGSTATFHVDFELSPILKEVDANDLRSYTIAKRDIELSDRGMKGSDKEAAQKVINELKMKYGADFGKIESTANSLYSYQDALVKKYLVDTGIISRKSYEAMRKNNKAYIPFKRVMDQVDGFLGATPQTKSMGSVSSQSVIKKIKGSDRDIIDPLQSIVENTYKIVTVGQRNKVAKAIISLRKQLPELIRPFSGEVGNRQDILSIFENGEVLKYQVPRDVAEAAKGLNEESLNALIKILAVPSKLVRATATGINPEFMIPNVTRDMQSAFVNVGLNPMTFVSGLSHLLKKDDVYQDFLRSGGKTSSIMIDRPYLKKTVGDITGKPGLEVLNPLRLLQTLGEYSEQPTRIAIFEKTKNKLIKQGLSIAEAEVQAANKAQEGTVNFARMGSKMKAANSLVTFLNARLQGADLLFRNVKSNPSGTLFRLGLVSQVPAVLSYLYNRQFESYNDERVVSKYDKEGNFVIMLSDSPIESLGGAQFIKIPKGDVGRFANPTESFLSYLDGKGDDNTVNEIAKAFLGLLPFQNIGDAIPAAIKPPIEWAANRSFFTKQPLVPEYKEALPAKYQYTSKTAPLYKIVGDKLNLSPAKLENTTAGYLTGFEKMGNTAFNALTGQKPDSQQGSGINRVPVARRFLGGEKRTSDEQSIIDDKRANSIDFQINDVKGAVNRGDVPMNEGVKQIELLRQKQQEIRNKQTTTAQMGNGSIKTEVQGQAGKTYYFKDTEGKLKEINISTPIQAPTMTGNAELDKKLVSKYNSKLSSRAGNIADLYQAGQISADEAEKLLSEIVNMKVSTAKGKTIKIGKVAKIKTPKIKLAKVKNVKFKIPKLKLARAKTIKFKSLKSKSLVKLKA